MQLLACSPERACPCRRPPSRCPCLRIQPSQRARSTSPCPQCETGSSRDSPLGPGMVRKPATPSDPLAHPPHQARIDFRLSLVRTGCSTPAVSVPRDLHHPSSSYSAPALPACRTASSTIGRQASTFRSITVAAQSWQLLSCPARPCPVLSCPVARRPAHAAAPRSAHSPPSPPPSTLGAHRLFASAKPWPPRPRKESHPGRIALRAVRTRLAPSALLACGLPAFPACRESCTAASPSRTTSSL